MSEYISGAMGYNIFEKDGKHVILFSDIHDGVTYCEQGLSSIRISELLKQKNE